MEAALDEFREPMATRAPPTDGPTLADLTYDDTLDDIERIARYGTSNVALQRLVHVKLMVDTARNVGCVPVVAQAVAGGNGRRSYTHTVLSF